MKTQNVVILPTSLDYLDQLVEVQYRSYDVPLDCHDYDTEMLTADNFRTHLRVFPEGQFMALDLTTNRIVGTSTSMIVDFDDAKPLLSSWRKTTADGSLRTHNPNGNWLYGVDSVVLKAYRGQGIGGRLIKARYGVARKLNLRGMIAGSMIIDYHKAAADGVDVETYVSDVVAGRRFDTNLSKQLRKGFRVHNIIPNYLTDSARTLNYAVAILWENPAYRAPKGLPKQRPARKHTGQVGRIR